MGATSSAEGVPERKRATVVKDELGTYLGTYQNKNRSDLSEVQHRVEILSDRIKEIGLVLKSHEREDGA